MSDAPTQALAQVQVNAPLVLVPPETIRPVVVEQVAGAIGLDPAVKQRADAQVNAFVEALTSADLRSEEFRNKLDAAFSLGRREIAEATGLSTAFTKKNFIGETDTPAYKALAEMRTVFDDLNPARQGDLFGSAKVFGVPVPTKVMGVRLPFGNKLAAYLRRFEAADGQINKLYEHLADAKLMIQTEVLELEAAREKLWSALGTLEGAAYFLDRLDERVASEVATLKVTDPGRSKALEQEVLYYVRVNAGDIKSTQALTINAYNIGGEIRKAGRELIIGCDRTMTLGMSALAVAVLMARATGVQVKVMQMLSQSKTSIEGLIVATGEGLKTHVTEVTKFSSDPLLGIEAMQQAFNLTQDAMNTMDTFRSTALEVQAANNRTLTTLVAEHTVRITNERKAAGLANSLIPG